MKKVNFIVSVFTKVTTCVVIATAFFVTIIDRQKTVDAMVLWQIPLVSFLCAISTLIYSWDKNMKKTEIRVRIAIHYIMINVIVLGAGYIFSWYNIKNIFSTLAMIVVIALIFTIVSVSSWRKARKEAEQMNEKLKKRFS